MEWSERVMPRSITTQITGVVAISVLLGIAIVAAIILPREIRTPSVHAG